MCAEVAISNPEYQSIGDCVQTRSRVGLRDAGSGKRAELCESCGRRTREECKSRVGRRREISMEVKDSIRAQARPLHECSRCAGWWWCRAIEIRGKISFF